MNSFFFSVKAKVAFFGCFHRLLMLNKAQSNLLNFTQSFMEQPSSINTIRRRQWRLGCRVVSRQWSVQFSYRLKEDARGFSTLFLWPLLKENDLFAGEAAGYYFSVRGRSLSELWTSALSSISHESPIWPHIHKCYPFFAELF